MIKENKVLATKYLLWETIDKDTGKHRGSVSLTWQHLQWLIIGAQDQLVALKPPGKGWIPGVHAAFTKRKCPWPALISKHCLGILQELNPTECHGPQEQPVSRDHWVPISRGCLVLLYFLVEMESLSILWGSIQANKLPFRQCKIEVPIYMICPDLLAI